MVFVNKSIEYTYLDATGGSSLASMSSSDALLKTKETSCAAVVMYDHLQLGKKWNLPGKHVNTAGVLSPSVAGATQVPTSASVLASLTVVINQHITNVESAEMSSFLGELCNVLRDVSLSQQCIHATLGGVNVFQFEKY
jgi:hypothetical protein